MGRRAGLPWLAAGLLLVQGLGAEPPRYHVRAWGSDEGLPQSLVSCLLVSRSGFLYLGTRAGLSRFDGLRFATVSGGPQWQWVRESVCTSLLEDEAGRIWIGTKHGLGCWENGRLRRYTTADGLGDDNILCLAPGSDGRFWVGAAHGISRWEGSRFSTREPGPQGAAFVHAAVETPEGTVWVGTSVGVYRAAASGGDFAASWGRPPEVRDGLGVGVRSLVWDGKSRVWFGTPQGAGWVSVPDGNVGGDLGEWTDWRSHDRTFLARLGGEIWAFDRAGPRVRQRDAWQPVELDRRWRVSRVLCVAEDAKGGIWVGTAGEGLWRLSPKPVRAVAVDDEDPSTAAWSVCESRAGGLWVATDAGLRGLREGRAESVAMSPDLTGVSLRAVFVDRRDDLWVGTAEDRFLHYHRHREGRTETWRMVWGSEHLVQAQAFAEDHDGAIWAGTKNGLFCLVPGPVSEKAAPGGGMYQPFREIWRFRRDAARCVLGARVWVGRNGVWRLEHPPKSRGLTLDELRALPGESWAEGVPEGHLTDNEVHAVIEDRLGRIWIGTETGGLNRLAGGRFEAWTTAEGLASDVVLALREAPDGAIWIGTDTGLSRWRDGRIVNLGRRDGLAVGGVNQILDDGRGGFWLGSNTGLFRAGWDDLNAVADGRRERVQGRLLGERDGLPDSETNGEIQPAGCRTSDGKLWVPTVRGLAVIDPARIVPSGPPPRPLLESVRLNGTLLANPAILSRALAAGSPETEFLPAVAPRRLDPKAGRFLQFAFVSVNLHDPEGTTYRYRLEGHDAHWIDARVQHTATYANLAPGRYRFEVVAENRHGIRSQPGAVFAFVLPPRWHQTVWFRATVLAFLGFAMLTFHRRRIRHRLELERLRTENRLGRERSRISRDLHDDLGAWLSRSLWLAEAARTRASREDSARFGLDQIVQSVRESLQTMRDAIWAAHPDNDTVEALLTRAAGFAQEFLDPLDIRCRLDFPTEGVALPLRAEMRRELLLAVQESVRNAVEHSGAREIRLAARLDDQVLTLTIADDGRGFEPVGGLAATSRRAPRGGRQRGLGLANLKQRIVAVGGRISIASQPGEGTKITLQLDLS